MGASPLRIVLRHIMPLCISSLIVRVTLDMAGIILTAAGLGFLGLGAQPPLPEWGAMIASGRRFILDQWWVAAMPGIAILIVSLGFNLLGDGLRDALDPKERRPMSGRSSTVDDLRVSFPTRTGVIEAVRGVSFTLGRERLGIVGESGSGKSQTGRAIMGLTPPQAVVTAERLDFDGIDLLSASAGERRALRGKRIAMVLQDPKYSLEPGDDHRPADRRDAAHRTRRSAGPKRASGRSPCWRPCRSATPSASSTSIRTRSPAAWASAP